LGVDKTLNNQNVNVIPLPLIKYTNSTSNVKDIHKRWMQSAQSKSPSKPQDSVNLPFPKSGLPSFAGVTFIIAVAIAHPDWDMEFLYHVLLQMTFK
jgi:hypothetical protein